MPARSTKRTRPTKRTKPTKTRRAATSRPSTVADYLAKATPNQRAALQALRRTIKAAAPDAIEGISYGIVGFKHKGERLIYYGYWQDHLSLYGFSSAWMAAHADELAKYDLRESTLRFTPEKPLPHSFVTRIVKGRLGEIDAAGGRGTPRG